MRLVTPEQMTLIEAEANRLGYTYEKMMQKAGEGLYSFLRDFAVNNQLTEILFLCGSGNNAGDCFIAAQMLSQQFHVTVCMVNGVVKTRIAYMKFKALKNVRIITDFKSTMEAVKSAALVVDGVFGIGFHGTLTPQIRQIFQLAEEKICVAADIPSGGNGLTGEATEGTLHCDFTVTFSAGKYGMTQQPLQEYCGDIILVDVGIPEQVYDIMEYDMFMLAQRDIRKYLPVRPNNSHKGDYGRLLCIAGSAMMPGAAILTATAALRCGVGTLCLASVPDACRLLVANAPEAMVLPLTPDADGFLTQDALPKLLDYAKTCSAVVIGCGLGRTPSVQALVRDLIKQLECPIILDADGLNAINGCIDILQEAKAPVILTPHTGELSRLLDVPLEQVRIHRLDSAKSLAQRFDIIVVHKGPGTVIVTKDHAFINTTGNSGMSKGGSGDVLAGTLGSFVAQGISPEQAACAAVFLHGLAGDVAAKTLSKRAMLPQDMIQQYPVIFRQLEQEAEDPA